MDTININGEEYIRFDEVAVGDYVTDWQHVCVIATNGWIFEGWRDDAMTDDNGIQLTRAHVVRKWTNGLGIGALADPEHKDEYTLDRMQDVYVYADKVIAVIPLRW